MNVASVVAELKKGGPIVTLVQMVKGVFDDKSSADNLYKELKPILDEYLMEGRRFQDPQVQRIVRILRELPAYGSRRVNFEKLYLVDEYTLRKLPNNPSDIPYGHWH
ncbi:hypothetical protein AB1K40_04440 [Vibrio cholerae]|uniref:hypothetical protein n=1 Tax=Vibrio cholerae TaxID=666 RepID=UPI00330A52CA|nr:hypothetical protein [Vibrio cholerae]HDL9508722.1 hypothetical protein [Vibrio cholerae]HDL9513887.1 hypothetical protein [Vibrio cholerae]